MYSTMRATIASNRSRGRLDSNRGSGRGGWGSGGGSGPARRARTARMASTARACAASRPPSSSRYALARMVTVWRRWSKAPITSLSITALSGSPITTRLGSGGRPDGVGFGRGRALDGADAVEGKEAGRAAGDGRERGHRRLAVVGDRGGG